MPRMRFHVRMLRPWLCGSLAAIGFLTILPVPEKLAERGRSHATVFFPWVGMAVGVVTAAFVRSPLDPVVGALLAVGALFVLTGGLHWDGLADVLDAVVTPGVEPERRIAILSDPTVGAHATVGVFLVLAAAVSALTRAPTWGVILGSALARWGMVVTLRWAPALRSEGAGAGLRREARPVLSALAIPALMGVLVAVGVPLQEILTVMFSAAVAATVAVTFLVRRLGGLNGDGHGAVGVVVEVTAWLAAAEMAGGSP